MKKRGFTLVELVACVVILGIIALLSFPPILNQIKKTKTDLSEATKEFIIAQTDLYVS